MSLENTIGLVVGNLIWMRKGLHRTGPGIYAWMTPSETGTYLRGMVGMTWLIQPALLLVSIGFLVHAATTGEWRVLWMGWFFPLAMVVVFLIDQVPDPEAQLMVEQLKRATQAEDSVSDQYARAPHPSALAVPSEDWLRSDQVVSGARLDLDGEVFAQAPNGLDISRAVSALNDTNFILLEFDNGHYMQVADAGSGLVVEHQAGGLDEHFRSVERVDRDSVEAALLHYLYRREPHPAFEWERIAL